MAVTPGILELWDALQPMWEVLQVCTDCINLHDFCHFLQPHLTLLTTRSLNSMAPGKKFLRNLKTTFRKKSPSAERPPENDISLDVPIAPGQPPGIGAHASTDSPGEGNKRNLQTTRAGVLGRNKLTDTLDLERTGSRGNNIAPTATRSDETRIIGILKNTIADNRLGVPDLVVSPPSFRYESQGIDSSTSDNRISRNNNDRELYDPLGRPPIGHFSSESISFHGTNNSAISFGGGAVNVSNVTGTLIQNNTTTKSGLALLKERVATSAFHNSAQRSDPPRCHPNTRVKIQNQIYDWILMDLFMRQTWIMWMHGAAGAGKSAIMQSIAELCEKARTPLASFFFFRTDFTRNSMASFFATLVYQLVQKIPQVRNEILRIIENNPLIFDESLESQLQNLIIQPLLRVQEHLQRFFVILIDGLDECTEHTHQSILIKLLGTISCSRTVPVIFLVASRREPEIEATFIRGELSDLVLTLPLDNSDVEQTSDDIRHFLVEKFTDIRETHLFKRYLTADWPSASMVNEIVAKSSGQFIFASVVINYISSPRANPSTQLDIIRGIRPRDPSSQNPFAHLDALYQHIFSHALEERGKDFRKKFFNIIAYVICGNDNRIDRLQIIFLLEDGEIDVLFADLTAVIECEPYAGFAGHASLRFLHASLPDFLSDEIRSGQYHIDIDEYRTNLLCRFLERCPIFDPLWPHDDLVHALRQEMYRLAAISYLLAEAKASEQLHRAFMNFNSIFYTEGNVVSIWYDNDVGPGLLRYLKQLDFNDQGEAYRHVLDVCALECTKYWPLLNDSHKERIGWEVSDLVDKIIEFGNQ